MIYFVQTRILFLYAFSAFLSASSFSSNLSVKLSAKQKNVLPKVAKALCSSTRFLSSLAPSIKKKNLF